jgi:hypothetical protein
MARPLLQTLCIQNDIDLLGISATCRSTPNFSLRVVRPGRSSDERHR